MGNAHSNEQLYRAAYWCGIKLNDAPLYRFLYPPEWVEDDDDPWGRPQDEPQGESDPPDEELIESGLCWSGTHTIQWEGNDSESENVTYRIWLSMDDGNPNTWTEVNGQNNTYVDSWKEVLEITYQESPAFVQHEWELDTTLHPDNAHQYIAMSANDGHKRTGNITTKRLMFDNSPPVTTILDLQNNPDYLVMWHTKSFHINLTAEDEISSVDNIYYRINSGPTMNVLDDGQPFFEGLDMGGDGPQEGGDNTLEYWAVDKASPDGNEEEHNFITNIRLDTTPPITTDNYDYVIHYEPFYIDLTAEDGDGSGVYATWYAIDFPGNTAEDELEWRSTDEGMPYIDEYGEHIKLYYYSIDVGQNQEDWNEIEDIVLKEIEDEDIIVFYPDLAIYAEEVQFSVNEALEGQEFVISVVVDNRGDIQSKETKAKFKVGEEIKQVDLKALSPGEWTKVTTKWAIDVPGTYEVEVEVDPDNRIAELVDRGDDDYNNIGEGEIDIVEKRADATPSFSIGIIALSIATMLGVVLSALMRRR
jgi:hypothetical protein